MRYQATKFKWCLEHQSPEDQVSGIGLVCSACKERLCEQTPTGRCFSCWESQPAAFSLRGEPCFIYTIIWDDFRIRTLHSPGSHHDPRSRNIRSGVAES